MQKGKNNTGWRKKTLCTVYIDILHFLVYKCSYIKLQLEHAIDAYYYYLISNFCFLALSIFTDFDIDLYHYFWNNIVYLWQLKHYLSNLNSTIHETCLLFIFFDCLIPGSVSEEICGREVQPEVLQKRIHKNSIPKGGASAGVYTKDKDSTNQWLCIVSCCQDSSVCDSAFFHKNTCYLIKCNLTYPGGCDAITKNSAKYNDTYYINVRDVGMSCRK